jgi:hypothetical protein
VLVTLPNHVATQTGAFAMTRPGIPPHPVRWTTAEMLAGKGLFGQYVTGGTAEGGMAGPARGHIKATASVRRLVGRPALPTLSGLS